MLINKLQPDYYGSDERRGLVASFDDLAIKPVILDAWLAMAKFLAGEVDIIGLYISGAICTV